MGWRVPFLLSAALVLVGLYIRVSVSESPVFRRAQAEMQRSRVRQQAPVRQVLTRYRREVLVAMGARFAENIAIDTGSFAAITLAVTGGLILHAMMYAPQAAYFAELFGTSVRYSGASIGYQLASVFAGSLAPIIAVALLGRYRSGAPISIYLAGSAVVTIVALLLSRETRQRELSADLGVDRAA